MSDTQTEVKYPFQESNPWIVALITLGAIALASGFVTLIVGVVNNANYHAPSNDSGIGEVYLGTAITSVGTLVMIAGFIIGGMDWSLRRYRNAEKAPQSPAEAGPHGA